MRRSDLLKTFKYNKRTGVLSRIKSGKAVGYIDAGGYLIANYKYKCRKVHRIIWVMMTGKMPKKGIDHKNTVRSDNRWKNLRDATQSQNCFNRKIRSDNKTGFKGITYQPSQRGARHYRAMICNKHIGWFLTPEEAHAAYCKTAKKIAREFSRYV